MRRAAATLAPAVVVLFAAALPLHAGLSTAFLVAALALSPLLPRSAGGRLPLSAPLAAYAAACLLSAAAGGARRDFLWEAHLLLFWLAPQALRPVLSDEAARRRVGVVFLGGFALSAIVAALSGRYPPIGDRMEWIGVSLAAAPLALAAGGVSLLALLPAVPALAMTRTMNGWLGLAAAALLLGADGRRRRLVPLLVGAAILLGAVAFLRPSNLMAPGDNLAFRLPLWSRGLALAAARPVFGHGFGSIGAGDLGPDPKAVHLHSDPLQVLVETGVVGLAAWLWLQAGLWRSTGRAGRAALAARWVAGLAEYHWGGAAATQALALVIALSSAETARGSGETKGDSEKP